jgi:hypothetical protein
MMHTDKNIPIFQNIFGDQWNNLPVVMKRHYANHPYSSDKAVVEGKLDVESSTFGRLMAPFFKLTGTLVPYEGKNIPATVEFLSSPVTNGFHFNRTFYFPNEKPYEFKSVMISMAGNEVAEVMRFGLCWRSEYIWTGQKIVLKHRGFGAYWFGKYIPLPIAFIMGKGFADETPIDDDHFSMSMELRHPLWGRVFGYSGTFKIVKDAP